MTRSANTECVKILIKNDIFVKSFLSKLLFDTYEDNETKLNVFNSIFDKRSEEMKEKIENLEYINYQLNNNIKKLKIQNNNLIKEVKRKKNISLINNEM